jgi:hypothetical protein
VASFALLLYGVQEEKLKEKFIDHQINLELIAHQVELFIDQDDDWVEEHQFYEDSLAFSIQILDELPMVFAALYDQNLQNVSSRYPSYESSPFDPLKYDAFTKAVQGKDAGTLSVIYGDRARSIPNRKMYLCFRWVPLRDSISDRYLLAVGISRYSIKSPMLNVFIGGILIFFSITLVASIGTICISLLRFSKHYGSV